MPSHARGHGAAYARRNAYARWNAYARRHANVGRNANAGRHANARRCFNARRIRLPALRINGWTTNERRIPTNDGRRNANGLIAANGRSWNAYGWNANGPVTTNGWYGRYAYGPVATNGGNGWNELTIYARRYAGRIKLLPSRPNGRNASKRLVISNGRHGWYAYGLITTNGWYGRNAYGPAATYGRNGWNANGSITTNGRHGHGNANGNGQSNDGNGRRSMCWYGRIWWFISRAKSLHAR